jgi:leucyl/phenylalanyl-tRNA---protein transferase
VVQERQGRILKAGRKEVDPEAMRGEELTPWLIHYGYCQGAFPMTMDDREVHWFQPYRRALFPIEGIRVSRSLARRIRSGVFEVTFDQAFEQVMRGCLRPDDNWISEDFIRVYTQIHREGWAHSCEAWHERKLVGGVYGIAIGSCFCAESMFHRKTDASKVALWALVNKCRELGFTIFDAQIMNPHLASLGAYEVSQGTYNRLFAEARQRTTPWSAPAGYGR